MGINKIYFKTMGFMWMKLGLGMVTVLLSAAWMGILYFIGGMFEIEGMGLAVLLILWICGTAAVNSILNHYLGYLVKAGHVAMIATAATTGQIPANQFAVAKQMVQERFVTSNVYFVLDKLVARSVSEIQGVLQKADNLLGNLPGMDTLVSILQLFVKIALNYVDECCLGYTFIHREENAFKSAADGVVIYVQNWKTLLKSAAVTTGIVIVMTLLACILPFIVLGSVFTALSWPRWIAAILSLLIAFCVKYAFIDSYMMVKTMVSYMQVAPGTVITHDLYGKLCGWSVQFKELIGKATQEGNAYQQPQYAGGQFQGAPYGQQQQYHR